MERGREKGEGYERLIIVLRVDIAVFVYAVIALLKQLFPRKIQ